MRAKLVGIVRLAALAIASAALAIAIGGCGSAGSPLAGDTAGAPAAWRSRIGFRTEALLEEHYRKHGREFGDVTRAQYLHVAQELRDRPAGGNVLEVTRVDGVVSRYDRSTGTFIAFNPDGVIRTCFKPRDGERYFRRQTARNERGR